MGSLTSLLFVCAAALPPVIIIPGDGSNQMEVELQPPSLGHATSATLSCFCVRATSSQKHGETKQNVTMRTEALLANLDVGEMQSDLPVEVTSPDAHITGQNIRVTDHGNVMMFGGTSKMVLHNVKAIN